MDKTGEVQGMGIIKNIAIVDDDMDTRLILERYLLDQAGFKVMTFSSGEELLKGLPKKKIDIILLDIEMPGMNGIDTYDSIKSSESKDIPIVFLTGKEDRATVLRCIGKGADGYLIKPVSKDSLISMINEIIEKYDKYKSNSTILMIDDDVDFLKIAKVKLSKYHKVLTVNSGKTALDYLISHSVDLIILDFFMPLYDGGSIMNILKSRESTRDIPVILVTALSHDEAITACAKNVPEEILTKPVDMDRLLGSIQKLLRERQRGVDAYD